MITAAEKNAPIIIKANVSGLDSDLNTQTISFFDGSTLLGMQTVKAGENSISVSANKLNAGTVSTRVNVADQAGNFAEKTSNSTAYTINCDHQRGG